MKTKKTNDYMNNYQDNTLSYLFNGFSNKIDYEIKNFDHDMLEIFHDQLSIGKDFITVIDKNFKGLSNNG